MRTDVLEAVSCKGNYCREALLVVTEAGQEGCV